MLHACVGRRAHQAAAPEDYRFENIATRGRTNILIQVRPAAAACRSKLPASHGERTRAQLPSEILRSRDAAC